MNSKLITYTIVVLIVGIAVGAIGRKEYDREEFESAVKKVDSLMAIENERQRVHDIFINDKTKKVAQSRVRLKKRNENFKNDSTILSSDELIKRIGAINDHDR